MPTTITPDTAERYRCHTCHEYLPLNEYYRAATWLGHQTECRSCGMERRRRRVAGRHALAIELQREQEALDLEGLTINETRTFGVEIECYVPRGRAQVASAIRTALQKSCRFEGYNHHDHGNWKIVTDSTVDTKTINGKRCTGMEIVSPGGDGALKGMAGLLEVQKVVATVRSLGGVVDRHTGLHCHQAARDLSLNAWKRLFALYLQHEEAIDGIMPPSRRGRHAFYCGGLTGRTEWACPDCGPWEAIERADTAHSLGSFFGRGKVNETSLWQHGTVEFRHHSGSLNFRKIANWICLTQAMVEVAVAGTYDAMVTDHEPRSLGHLLRVCDASPQVTSFYYSRMAYFVGDVSMGDSDAEAVAA